jgi:hypothetical protein
MIIDMMIIMLNCGYRFGGGETLGERIQRWRVPYYPMEPLEHGIDVPWYVITVVKSVQIVSKRQHFLVGMSQIGIFWTPHKLRVHRALIPRIIRGFTAPRQPAVNAGSQNMLTL